MREKSLLVIKDLYVYFKTFDGELKVLDGRRIRLWKDSDRENDTRNSPHATSKYPQGRNPLLGQPNPEHAPS